MAEKKKDLVLFIAESRSTYDFSSCKDTEEEYSEELTKRMFEVKRALNADAAILSSVTFDEEHNIYASDWDTKKAADTLGNQCYIEGFYDGEGNFHQEENAHLGTCFFPQANASLAKGNDEFGEWKMETQRDNRSVSERVTEYIRSLNETYNVKHIFFFFDYGYDEAIFDTEAITRELKPYIHHFIPKKPYRYQENNLFIDRNGCKVCSDETSIEGVVRCFDLYSERLEEISSKLGLATPNTKIH